MPTAGLAYPSAPAEARSLRLFCSLGSFHTRCLLLCTLHFSEAATYSVPEPLFSGRKGVSALQLLHLGKHDEAALLQLIWRQRSSGNTAKRSGNQACCYGYWLSDIDYFRYS